MRFHRLQRLINFFRADDYHRVKLIIGGSRLQVGLTLVALLILISLPLALLKLWPATPPHAPIQQRMSVVDWLQSRALSKKAKEMTDKAPLEKSRQWWRSAIGNYPGNIELNRDYLRVLLHSDTVRNYWLDARQTTFWLLLLSQTNQADLALAADIFEHYHADYFLLQTLTDAKGTETPSLQGRYLKALFRTERLEEFETALSLAETNHIADPALELYAIAHRAMGTNQTAAAQAKAHLESLRQSNTDVDSLLPSKLLLQVHYHLEDHEAFEVAFKTLSDRFEERPRDHFRRWELLLKNGKRTEAQQAAEAFVPAPRSGGDVLAAGNAYLKVGLPDLGFRFLQHHAHQFGFSGTVWRTQADVLTAKADWKALRRLAIRIRQAPGVNAPYVAYSYFVEGSAAIGLGENSEGLEQFKKIQNYELGDTDLGLYMGLKLWEKGFNRIAETILEVEAPRYGDNLIYWMVRSDLAEKLNSPQTMLLAARKLHELQPDDLHYGSQYAALLLSERIFIEKAMTLTYRAWTADPTDTMLQINYAHALLLQERYPEALKQLMGLNPKQMTATHQQAFYLARSELYFRNGQFETARQSAKPIIPEMLLPGDQEYYRSMMATIEAELQ